MKQALIRQVTSLHIGCDAMGNHLLAKFSCHSAKDSALLIPASVAFWLADNIPANEDPALLRPPEGPAFEQQDWDDAVTPRALSVRCKQFPDAVRMSFELNRKPDLVLLLGPENLELMRRLLMVYRTDLTDLGPD